MSRFAALFENASDSRRYATTLAGVVGLLVTGYAVVHGAQVMRAFGGLTVSVGVNEAWAFEFLRLYVTRAPVLTLLLLGIPALNVLRGGSVVLSPLLPAALLLGMAMAIYGVPPKLLNVPEPAAVAGLVLGLVGTGVGIAGREVLNRE